MTASHIWARPLDLLAILAGKWAPVIAAKFPGFTNIPLVTQFTQLAAPLFRGTPYRDRDWSAIIRHPPKVIAL